MKKFIATIFILLLVIMLPILTVFDTVLTPIKALGNGIKDLGNVSVVNEEIEETTEDYFLSLQAQEIESYIYDTYYDDDDFEKIDITLIHITMMIISPEIFEDEILEEETSLKDTQAFKYVDEMVKVMKQVDTQHEYWDSIKKNRMFKMIDLTTETLMVYTDFFSNNDHVIGSDDNEFENKGEYRLDSPIYQSAQINPFIPTYRGQCTWFAWSRAKEVTGKDMPTGNAATWYDSWSGNKSARPVNNSVGVFSNGIYGHVIFIENIDEVNNTITFSESNYNNPCLNGSCDMVEYARINYKELTRTETMPYSVFKVVRESAMGLRGYIY